MEKKLFLPKTYKILKFRKFCANICFQIISILIMKEVISFVKKSWLKMTILEYETTSRIFAELFPLKIIAMCLICTGMQFLVLKNFKNQWFNFPIHFFLQNQCLYFGFFFLTFSVIFMWTRQLKGTVAWDFWLRVFSMNWPLKYFWILFRICRDIGI